MGRLAGGEGRLPESVDLGIPFLDVVLRRALIVTGRGMALSPASLRPAATATAATLAPVMVMLLRRVTRWVGLSDPEETEWELFRECDSRLTNVPPVIELEDIDGRWDNGRGAACVSCSSRRGDQHGAGS